VKDPAATTTTTLIQLTRSSVISAGGDKKRCRKKKERKKEQGTCTTTDRKKRIISQKRFHAEAHATFSRVSLTVFDRLNCYFFFSISFFFFRCVVVFVVFVVFDVGIDELLGTSDSVIRRMRIVSKKHPFDFYNNESLNSIVRHAPRCAFGITD
jgi:hypothetical protein